MSDQTTFTDPAAVDAWDAWFRWREAGVLRDRTIEATWERLVQAVAHVEREDAACWSQRWRDGFRRWQWLPDETLLRCAGTGAMPRVYKPVTAALNLAAFVRPAPLGAGSARLDVAAIRDAAALAMRFLDDALLAMAGHAECGIRIGLLGLADALAALEIEYDSAAALQVADGAGAALAAGALRGAVELGRERGGVAPDRARLETLSQYGLPDSLVEQALRWGVRHEIRTAIAPARRLALLANNVADALDPRNPGRRRGPGRDPTRDATALPSTSAQRRLRSALQPWIDVPIDYPFAIGPAMGDSVPDGAISGPFAPLLPLHR